MGDVDAELRLLAQHLKSRRDAILQAWRTAIKRDPNLTSSDALPKADFYDHIPALLANLERQLERGSANRETATTRAHEDAAAHGLQRWQQGYDLREVTRELGKLNEVVTAELDEFTERNQSVSHAGMGTGRRIWAQMCSTGIEESVAQYFALQQQESAGHVKDLESGLEKLQELEQQRADLWRQAAHDLRGNLGVVANATVGLTNTALREPSRDAFVRILMRNVTSLHHLLDDVTSLARLQAGKEERRIEPLDITTMMQELCEGIRPMAQQQRLFLRCEGPPGFGVDGDKVKIRRVAQNLILNAVKFTREGGITVAWGPSERDDAKRWQLSISDSGPGFASASSTHLTQALEMPPDQAQPEYALGTVAAPAGPAASFATSQTVLSHASGEGLGLSIVKRMCDMLDASIECASIEGVGTTFKILFPRRYE